MECRLLFLPGNNETVIEPHRMISKMSSFQLKTILHTKNQGDLKMNNKRQLNDNNIEITET